MRPRWGPRAEATSAAARALLGVKVRGKWEGELRCRRREAGELEKLRLPGVRPVGSLGVVSKRLGVAMVGGGACGRRVVYGEVACKVGYAST